VDARIEQSESFAEKTRAERNADAALVPEGRQPADRSRQDSKTPPLRVWLREHWIVATAAAILIAAALTGGLAYWINIRHYESTDDAFVAARSFSVAAKVGGYVTDVPVTDNQHVQTGDLLARIDDRDYKIALDQANAQLAVANANIENIQAQLDSQREQIEQASAQLDQARLNVQYRAITAAQGGRVAKLTAANGTLVTQGQSLMMFVPDDMWIVANYKETQLRDMRPGQPVEFTIDAYPGRKLTGHVDSVQPGSGTAFSLLPAENATGNYVKVVQRVPVKIAVDNWPSDVPVGPGMSVVPWVKVR
jgi:multidrug resistance efflux pump